MLELASMRPGPIGPGIARSASSEAAGIAASMRPGPIGPGIYNNDGGKLTWKEFASMRPGPIGPGIEGDDQG